MAKTRQQLLQSQKPQKGNKWLKSILIV
jgi:hypothetical protein